MSTTSSEADFLSSDNDDDKPIVIREFSGVQLPHLNINDDVVAFSHTHPPPPTEALSDQQLLDRLNWCSQINEKLSDTLRSLQNTLQAEWAAKEQLLEKVLEKEIGGNWRLP